MRTEPFAPSVRYLYQLNRSAGLSRLQSLLSAITHP